MGSPPGSPGRRRGKNGSPVASFAALVGAGLGEVEVLRIEEKEEEREEEVKEEEVKEEVKVEEEVKEVEAVEVTEGKVEGEAEAGAGVVAVEA